MVRDSEGRKQSESCCLLTWSGRGGGTAHLARWMKDDCLEQLVYSLVAHLVKSGGIAGLIDAGTDDLPCLDTDQLDV